MSLVLIVYLIGVLPSISATFGILGSIGLLVSTAAGFGFLSGTFDSATVWASEDEKQDMVKKISTCKRISSLCFKLIPVSLLSILIANLVPSEKTMYYMVAAYGTEKLIENPVAKDLASDGVDVLKQLLAKAKKELQEPETPTKKDIK
jgi:hypothetical protein